MQKMRYLIVLLTIFSSMVSFSTLADSSPQTETNSLLGVEPDNKIFSERGDWTDDIFYGGSGSFQISTGRTQISLSPMIGYKVTEKLRPGISARFMYFRQRSTNFFPSYQALIYGGSVFTRYHFTNNILGMIEFEALNVTFYDDRIDDKTSEWMHSIIAGGGYRTRIGDRAHAEIMVLYNFMDHSNYPYNNPIIRVGLSF